MFDLPATLRLTEKAVKEAGLESRITLRAGDFNRDELGLATMGGVISVQSVDAAAVVSPIFGVDDQVVGLVYGMRQQGSWATLIRPLKHSSCNCWPSPWGAISPAASRLRTRVQFEQFFSPELARELERNPTCSKAGTRKLRSW